MASANRVVQFAAAICGSLLARAFFGVHGHLAATIPPHGASWAAAGFEAVITFGLVLTAFQNKTPLIVTTGQQTREMLLLEPWLTTRSNRPL